VRLGNGGTTGSIAGDVGGFGTFSFNRSDTVTFGGIVSGNFWLRQDGPGTTILTGANSYAFGTIVNAGTLRLGPGGTLGTSAALTMNGGTLDLNNTNQTVGAAEGTGGFITLGSGTLTVTVNNGGALASVISGTGGIQVTAGQLKLAADDTYTGGTVISGTGTLQIGNGGTTGSVVGDITDNSQLVFNRSDTYTFSNVASGSGRLLQFGTGRLILTGTNTYTGGTEIDFGPLQIGNGGTTGSIVGNVVATGGGIVFDRSDNVVFNGVISGGNVSQIGSGTLTLTAVNPLNGNIRVSQGSLIIAGSGGLTSSNIFVFLSGTGNFFSDASLSMRDLNFTGGTSSIAVATGQTMDFNLSMELTGSGTITFGNPTRAGTININASFPSVGAISIDVAGGTLRDTTLSPNSSGGGAVSIAALAASQFTVESGAIVDFNNHSVRLNSNASLGANLRGAGQILLGSSASTEMRLKSTIFSGAISGAGSVTFLSGTNPHILTGSNAYAGGSTVNSGATLQLGAGGTAGSITGNVIDNGALVFNRSDSIAFGGVISGTGSLTDGGSGTLTLTGANTYTGGTTINSGATLQLGNGGTTGSISGNVVDNGNLVFNRSDSVTFGGVISGSGGVTQEGGAGVIVPVGTLYNGVVTLTGVNTYSGATLIDHGTLAIAGNGRIANSSSVTNYGTLDISSANGSVIVKDLTSVGGGPFQGWITLGRNTLVIANATGTLSGYVNSPYIDTAGITVLAGNLTLNLPGFLPGTLTINSGATVKSVLGNSLYGVKLINNGALDISAMTLGGDGVGDLSGSGVVIMGNKDFQVYQGLDRQVSTFSGTITGSGQFSVADSTLILTGANTYTGGTFVANATFQLGNGGTAGSVVGNIGSNGGLVVFNRSDAVTFSGVISGTGAVMQQGPGTLIFRPSFSWSVVGVRPC